jgi:hypothetical protein
MSENSNKPKTLFWIIGVIAVIWNLMGVAAYLSQAYMTDAYQDLYNAEQLEIITGAPSWAVGAFAIAVFGGTLGSILMLFRKRLANILLSISFVGIVVQLIYNFFMANSLQVFGAAAAIQPVLTLVFGLFLVIYTKNKIKEGILS